jgi:hypothetical protein
MHQAYPFRLTPGESGAASLCVIATMYSMRNLRRIRFSDLVISGAA